MTPRHNANMTRGEASIDVWNLCGSLTDLILTAGIRPPHGEREQRDRFRTWKIDTATGHALTRTIVSLALHTAIKDQTTAQSGEASEAAEDLDIRELADGLNSRPRHELFAGIPLSQLGEQDRTCVNALRLMAYSAPSPATIALERLVQEARTTLLRAADTLPSHEPRLGALRSRLR